MARRRRSDTIHEWGGGDASEESWGPNGLHTECEPALNDEAGHELREANHYHPEEN